MVKGGLSNGSQTLMVAITTFQGLEGRAVELTSIIFQEVTALGGVKIRGDQALVAFESRG
jgi:hypothetical protein